MAMTPEQKLRQICEAIAKTIPVQIDQLASADHNIGFCLLTFYGGENGLLLHTTNASPPAAMAKTLRNMADQIDRDAGTAPTPGGNVIKLVPDPPDEKTN